jgi:lysophospholipase L1-like esterase
MADSLAWQQTRPDHRITGVCIGNSIIAGHPWRYSGLELGLLNWQDSFGQICYHLAQLTHFKWTDHGWGGQTTAEIRHRFPRDVLGDTIDEGDGRQAITLTERPVYVVIEGGLNDISANIPLDSIEANIAWMASTCKNNAMHCIVLNTVGQGNDHFSAAQIATIFALNAWEASGVLDSVQATVVDINSIWNSGTYLGVSPDDNDNVHYSTLVNPVDGLHFTPAGYDSIAHIIYRVARLVPR